jgi:hypothetical protein
MLKPGVVDEDVAVEPERSQRGGVGEVDLPSRPSDLL